MRRRSDTGTVAALAALLVLAVALAACGTGDGASGSASDAGEPVEGGTLTVTFQGEPAALDPAIAWEIESWCIERLTYQTFLTYASEPGEAGTRLVPDLATEVPSAENGGISADGRVYTFHLREGVKFAQPLGREVTAADFKWSFQRMMKEPLAPATFFYTGVVGAQKFMDGKADEIRGYEVVDDFTVRITLDQPDGAFLMAMTMPFTSVMPREWVEKVGEDVKRRPLGTGPYVITDWQPDRSMTAVRNEYWTGPDDQWVDQMHFDFTATPGTALLRLENGEVDVLGDAVPAADYVRTRNDPAWSEYIVEAPQIAWYWVFMNVLEEPFDDVRVRQAVSHAIDTARIQRLLAGQCSALGQIYPDGMPGHQAGKTFYAHDPEEARRLLAEAGLPDGFTTTLVSHNVDPFPRLAQSIQADLKAVGINVDIKQMSRAVYWDYISLRDRHAAFGLSDWYQDFPDPSDWVAPLFTSPEDGGANASFYENPEVDRLYAASASKLDRVARIGMFEQMQDIIMADAPAAPLYQPIWTGMHGKATGGVYIHPVWTYSFQEYWKTDGT